jgi:TonB-dependent SusC/RagA subfamily outer membrane receptor
MKRLNLIIALILLVVGFVNAQTTVSGKVLNHKNKPVSGAVMYLDTLAITVITNKSGGYSLIVPDSIKNIKVYSKKLGWLSSAYAKESTMDFMYLDTAPADPSLTPPNGLNPDKDKTTVSFRTIYDMMRGRIAGVVVQQDNTIIVRGINSIRNNSEPLFIVDGNFVQSIDFVVPNQVLSITVLKDAEASIYGSRGASGVIVIKLKK